MCNAGSTIPPDDFKLITLHDVQAMNGGQNVFVAKDGKVSVQLVDVAQGKGLFEKRYVFLLNTKQAAVLANTIAEHDPSAIVIPQRDGVPDEAQPTITVTMSSGKITKISKWSNDAHPDFDAVYHVLLDIVQTAKSEKVVFEGEFDPQWGSVHKENY